VGRWRREDERNGGWTGFFEVRGELFRGVRIGAKIFLRAGAGGTEAG